MGYRSGEDVCDDSKIYFLILPHFFYGLNNRQRNPERLPHYKCPINGIGLLSKWYFRTDFGAKMPQKTAHFGDAISFDLKNKNFKFFLLYLLDEPFIGKVH